jgi:hypothetical protein
MPTIAIGIRAVGTPQSPARSTMKAFEKRASENSTPSTSSERNAADLKERKSLRGRGAGRTWPESAAFSSTPKMMRSRQRMPGIRATQKISRKSLVT